MKAYAALLTLFLATGCGSLPEPAQPAITIICPADAPAQVKLAAKEVRRYVYLRTGELLSLAESATGDTLSFRVDNALSDQQYRLESDGKSLIISGSSSVAVLYGAYAFAEKLGVRFQIAGDVIPDTRVPLVLPVLSETHQPLFRLRGLQPFHDFPEGPDWWTREDWLAFVGQAAKMRMNFVGLHTYPFHNKDLGPEPTVWMGLPEDVNTDGTVKTSDYASWYTTAKFQPYGCYQPERTSTYSFGGAEVFPTDDYGSEVNMPDDFPLPKTPAANVALINRTGALLRDVFTEAHLLGMTTCVGTESPLDIPDTVNAQLKQAGLDPAAPATLQALYAGMFTRIQRAYPIDYYWIWGHEGEIDQARFLTNLQCAQAALKETKAPFGLGICGWGWITGNFPALDQVLPKDVVFSAINMSVGNAPVSPNFARLGDRPKWAIPWFEDDGGLTSPQLWVGRMRKDAADALRYHCDGLMGLHWRTRVMGPNIVALAQAGWDQADWNTPADAVGKSGVFEVQGGEIAAFLNNTLTGTEDLPLYQFVRYGMVSYRIPVPDGEYTVVLRFNEPAYNAPGKRVFGVKVQGQPVIENLDIFAKVGQNAAFDLTYPGIYVTGGALRLDFAPVVEYPCIAAIEVRGADVTRKINCGGPAYKDFEADTQSGGGLRFLPVADFYTDWSRAEFGPSVAEPVAAIFTKLDGYLPRASTWANGPGVVAINRQPWAQVAPQHVFVDELAALRPQVQGVGNLERFDWWLNTLRFNRAMARLGCARGALDVLMEKIDKESDAAIQQRLAREQALPQRRELLTLLADMYGYLLATLHNASELGTICNIEQQSMLRTKLITIHDPKLRQLLGESLPVDTHPWQDYRGPARLVVLTARGSQHAGESLPLRIIALDRPAMKSIVVRMRPLGNGEWKTIPATHLARAVWNATLPAAADDFEYHVVAESGTGAKLTWPATAPELNQTVVIHE